MPLDPTGLSTPDIAPTPARPLEPGAPLGHYRIVERIGAGGMGEIYRAVDEKLDREVAIKVLAPALLGSSEGLVREAQTLARLSHPNVVTVYEVGTDGDRVFVAMELVVGKTLRAWLAAERRSWRVIVAAFAAAGRGLAAAHRAGIVHRDFKPDNVLVGDDGRVRVVDFGLAAGDWSGMVAGSPALLDTVRYSAAVSGTPAYMAPEQHLRIDVDARADQFAFAVSLYEALYRARPFPGKTADEVRDRVLAGTLATPPAGGPRPPARLYRICKRGLELAPARRYPTMEALLAELERDRRALVWRGLAVGALVLAAAVVLVIQRTAGPQCDRGQARLAAVWNGKTRAAVRAAFTATGRASAADTFGRVERLLDGFAAAWGERHLAACEDTRVRGVRSAVAFDLRMDCLEQRAAALGELTTLLAGRPDPAVLDSAVVMAGRLGELSLCDDVATLEKTVPPPADPALRKRLDALLPRIAHMKLEGYAGREREVSAMAPDIVAEARAIGHAPTLAQALFLAADNQRELGHYAAAEAGLRETIAEAARASDDRTAAQAWAQLLATLNQQGRDRDSVALADLAFAAVVRARTTPTVMRSALVAAAVAYGVTGKPAVEQALLGQALVLATAFGAGYEVGTTMNFLGLAFRRQKRYADAETMFRRAEARFAEALGEQHPDIAMPIANLASVMLDLGRNAEADAQLVRAIHIWEKTLGPDSASIGNALGTRGYIARIEGRYDEALVFVTRAEEIVGKARGLAHPSVARLQMSRARVLRALTSYDQAYDEYARALATLEKTGESPDVVDCLVSMATMRVMTSRAAEGRPLAQRALEIATRIEKPEGALVARATMIVGEAMIRDGRPAEGLADVARAGAMFEKSGSSSDVASSLSIATDALLALRRYDEASANMRRAIALNGRPTARWLAGSRFKLAQAMWGAGTDRRGALALASDARAEFVREGALGAQEVSEVDAWLATTRRRR